MTGKIGKNAVGFFGAYDRLNNLLFPSNQGSLSTSLEQDVSSGVFRYRRDVGRRSTLGFLYAGRLAELGLGRHVNINLQHAFQMLALKGKKIFAANLSQIRLVYNFNIRTFVRGYSPVSRCFA